jgi:hypothetical protein
MAEVAGRHVCEALVPVHAGALRRLREPRSAVPVVETWFDVQCHSDACWHALVEENYPALRRLVQAPQ